MGSYRVKTRWTGKKAVEYSCPHCGTALESPLGEAGQTYLCPACKRIVETPGINEWRAEQAAVKRQAHEQRAKKERERAERQARADGLRQMQVVQRVHAQRVAENLAAEAVFNRDGIIVTRNAIIDGHGQFPLYQILAVMTRRGFFSGFVVDVFDLADRCVSYKFSNTNNAVDFIATIRDINGSITIRREEVSVGWIIWW